MRRAPIRVATMAIAVPNPTRVEPSAAVSAAAAEKKEQEEDSDDCLGCLERTFLLLELD